jgi:hypothetical protein
VRNKSLFLAAILILIPFLGMYLFSRNEEDVRLTFHLFAYAIFLFFIYASSATSLFFRLGLNPTSRWVPGLAMTVILAAEGLLFGRHGLVSFFLNRMVFTAFFLAHIFLAIFFMRTVWSPDVKMEEHSRLTLERNMSFPGVQIAMTRAEESKLARGMAFGFSLGMIITGLAGGFWGLQVKWGENISFSQGFNNVLDSGLGLLGALAGASAAGVLVLFRLKKKGASGKSTDQ